MITWLFQELGYDRDNETMRFAYAIKELGHEVIIKEYTDAVLNDYDFMPKDQPVAIHGSIKLIQHAQQHFKHPHGGIWCDWKILRCQHYYAKLGKFIAQKHYGFYPLAEIMRLRNNLYDCFGRGGKIFIRPDTNDKIFTGEVVEKDNLDRWYDSLDILDRWRGDGALCVVSSPVRFDNEYRFVIADGKVVAGSQYMEGRCLFPTHKYSDEARDYAEMAAAVWSPHPVYVMDIGHNYDVGFSVIEIGSWNVAGFYKNDVHEVVKAVTVAIEREWKDLTVPVEDVQKLRKLD